MSTMTPFRSALAIVVFCALGCLDSSGGAGIDCKQRRVRMSVASSLREVALSLREELLAHDQPIDVELIFGASSLLARQLALGAPMDVLVSADAKIVDDLVRRHLLTADSVVEFARGRLVLAASREWPLRDAGLDALDSSELRRIAIPAASVPLGRYARDWLERSGRLDQLDGKVVTTEHARATLTAVDAGHADLAIVYESDARLARHAVVLARIEPSEHAPIRYVAARVTAAPPCDSIDTAIAAWADPTMTKRLIGIGFLPASSSQEF
jgi:molybdate transport system substrate-binding protein